MRLTPLVKVINYNIIIHKFQ